MFVSFFCGKDQSDIFVALFDLVKEFEGSLAAFGAEDAVVCGIFAAQVALDPS